jgi:hypothetical protein
MKKHLGLALALCVGATTLAACGSLVGNGGPEGLGTGKSWFWFPSAKARTGRIVVHTKVESQGYQVQEVVEAYTRASINHLVVKVFEVDDNGTPANLSDDVETHVLDGSGNPVMADIPASLLDSPLQFGNLFANTHYRIRAYAYKAPGTAAEDQISDNSASYTDVQVGNDNQVIIAMLRCKLIDVDFSATAGSVIDIVDGGYRYAGYLYIRTPAPAATPMPEPTAQPTAAPTPTETPPAPTPTPMPMEPTPTPTPMPMEPTPTPTPMEPTPEPSPTP